MKKGVRSEVKKMGPLKVAKLNGLSVSRQPVFDEIKDEPEQASNDERVRRQVFFVNETGRKIIFMIRTRRFFHGGFSMDLFCFCVVLLSNPD